MQYGRRRCEEQAEPSATRLRYDCMVQARTEVAARFVGATRQPRTRLAWWRVAGAAVKQVTPVPDANYDGLAHREDDVARSFTPGRTQAGRRQFQPPHTLRHQVESSPSQPVCGRHGRPSTPWPGYPGAAGAAGR
jgi:hypothetical protein